VKEFILQRFSAHFPKEFAWVIGRFGNFFTRSEGCQTHRLGIRDGFADAGVEMTLAFSGIRPLLNFITPHRLLSGFERDFPSRSPHIRPPLRP
jgi:hypothetical protein